jgi:hypothetical protein
MHTKFKSGFTPRKWEIKPNAVNLQLSQPPKEAQLELKSQN